MGVVMGGDGGWWWLWLRLRLLTRCREGRAGVGDARGSLVSSGCGSGGGGVDERWWWWKWEQWWRLLGDLVDLITFGLTRL